MYRLDLQVPGMAVKVVPPSWEVASREPYATSDLHHRAMEYSTPAARPVRDTRTVAGTIAKIASTTWTEVTARLSGLMEAVEGGSPA